MDETIRFKIIGKHIDIYLEWLTQETIEMPEILAKYNMNSQTFYNIMNKWIDEGLVSRNKKEKKERVREGFYQYSLTEKGSLLMEELRKRLSQKKLEGFEEHLSKILQELGIKITDDDFTVLLKKIITYLS